MKKSERIAHIAAAFESSDGLDPRYAGFFTCFNEQRYYEAHDVLEDLWLETPGPDHGFFKGLIQLAGAFVHLQKQFARPGHPKDGRRLHPAVRLLRLAQRNLAPFAPGHLHFRVQHALDLAANTEAAIVDREFTSNPWHPGNAPRLELGAHGTQGELSQG
jgi:hypothetical protein